MKLISKILTSVGLTLSVAGLPLAAEAHPSTPSANHDEWRGREGRNQNQNQNQDQNRQRGGYENNGWDHQRGGYENNGYRREQAYREQIIEGQRRGELTPDEVRRLNAMHTRVEAMEAAMRWDGRTSYREQARIREMEQRLNQRIALERRDNERCR